MRLIDRDVHEAYRDFERAVQLTKSYPLGKHLSSPIQTTGNDLEKPLPAFNSACRPDSNKDFDIFHCYLGVEK